MTNHVDYPHEPGRLYDCGACEARCHCTSGDAECVYEGEHTPTAPAPVPDLMAALALLGIVPPGTYTWDEGFEEKMAREASRFDPNGD